ncbi:MAG TPA: hypothetical protein DF383_04580, partial [Deltaproteobacteria bacterium]|nr:hypothetical protein [Deltaproteobacteria bacterium]
MQVSQSGHRKISTTDFRPPTGREGKGPPPPLREPRTAGGRFPSWEKFKPGFRALGGISRAFLGVFSARKNSSPQPRLIARVFQALGVIANFPNFLVSKIALPLASLVTLLAGCNASGESSLGGAAAVASLMVLGIVRDRKQLRPIGKINILHPHRIKEDPNLSAFIGHTTLGPNDFHVLADLLQ